MPKLTHDNKGHHIQPNLGISDVIHCPDELEPVLAKIEHIGSLGKSIW